MRTPAAVRRDRFPSPAMLAIGLVASVVIGLSACSSGSSGGPSAAPTTLSTSTSTASASTAAPSVAVLSAAPISADDCGGAVGRVGKAVASFPQVTKVEMIAACGTASIETDLPPGVLGSASATEGVKICSAAAGVAYQGQVGSVTVDAKDGSELAIGLKGSDCIP